MENFIVSARKYRPATFMSVVGQSALTATLKNAIRNNHLAHAYLFCGPRGVGKTTCARIFAKTINCAHLTPEFEACNECESCRAFNEQRSYNIHELDAASNNSVDDIRTLIDQVRIPPQIGHYSVYIIDEVHMLSASAFNAFLKTLEEPPAHAIFILATTEKHKILPTILSRCQIYDFNRISVNDTVEHLQHVAKKEGINAEPQALNVIAQKADGGMRDALSIFDQVVSFCGNDITYQAVIQNLNVLDYDYYFKLTDVFLENKVKEALLIFNEILNKGFDAHNFVGGLSSHLRDVLMCKDPETVQLLEVADSVKESYASQAQKCPNDFLYSALAVINDCDMNFRLSRNKRLLTELTLIRLCQLTDKKKNELNEDFALPPIELIPEMHLGQPDAQQANAAPIQRAGATIAQPVATTSQPAAQPAKKNIVSAPPPISISITKPPVKKEEAGTRTTVRSQQTEKQDNSFTVDSLEKAWKHFATEVIPEKTHAKNIMLNNLPTTESKHKLKLVLDQILQENSMNEVLYDLTSFLRRNLMNDFVELEIIVDTTKENTKVMSPQDKFAKMAESNPALLRLKKEFGLEID
ncbi:DNA polymerase III subunit gamma/tau [Paludibacter sp.]|uniref:DNA polymerase III subunit gamma/tau n=1 Tax=Paludibacter sp. TaxID=1898105 RepID=UPI0013544AA9|nr:DNA polymerase III subunit gamma/tau [Paludibacter sp.]MTK53381.1 DNA polymerase III subunit gamma/tau [Paludibacter sp.]